MVSLSKVFVEFYYSAFYVSEILARAFDCILYATAYHHLVLALKDLEKELVVHIQNGTSHTFSPFTNTKRKPYKNEKVQRYKSIEIQKYKSIEIQKYKSIEIQKYRNTERRGNRIWSCILKPALLLAHSTFTILPIFYPSPQNSDVFASYSLPTVLLLWRSRVAEISKCPKETEHLTRWEDFGEVSVNLLH